MDSRRNEIKVGIAVLLSLVLLVGGIMWGKGYRLRTARYTIDVVFDNVGGLEPGSNVLANGVVKGRVNRIVLHEGKVTVRASVDNSVTLYSDYRITIESPTVMAGKVLALYPGGKLPPADISRPLTGLSPMGMGEAVAIFESISSDFKTALHNLNALVLNLNRIVGDTANQQNVAAFLDHASGAAQTSEEWLAANREQLTAAVHRLDTALASAQRLVQSTETRLDATLSGVDSAALQIGELAASLRGVLDKLNREEGSLGKLLADDEFYVRLNRTLAEVDSLARTIRTKGLRNRIVLF